MKVKHTKTLKDGRKHVLIELNAGESMPTPALNVDAFYKLNYPMDDQIVEGHLLFNPQRVYWDSVEQKWMES